MSAFPTVLLCISVDYHPKQSILVSASFDGTVGLHDAQLRRLCTRRHHCIYESVS